MISVNHGNAACQKNALLLVKTSDCLSNDGKVSFLKKGSASLEICQEIAYCQS